jgi:hypothetical protein
MEAAIRSRRSRFARPRACTNAGRICESAPVRPTNVAESVWNRGLEKAVVDGTAGLMRVTARVPTVVESRATGVHLIVNISRFERRLEQLLAEMEHSQPALQVAA